MEWLEIKSRWSGIFALLIVVTMMVVACVAPTPQVKEVPVEKPVVVTATSAPLRVVKIGIHALLTGPDSVGSITIFNGATLAIEHANAKGVLPGYRFEAVMLDDTTPATGQADPAQAATNARKFVGDPQVVAAIGPQFSGLSKAVAPIYSEANMATISPSATNPDLTDPKFAAEYRPAGKPGFFRVCATDDLQSPAIANYAYNELGVRKVFVLDDSSAFGVGTADAFERRAKEKGMEVLGRDRLDPNAADYSPILTKVKGLDPDAVFYGGHTLAGSKLAVQMQSAMPGLRGLSTDGIAGADFVEAAGEASENWLVTLAAPNLEALPAAQQFIEDFTTRFGTAPVAYSGLAYDAVNVVIDAVGRVADGGKSLTQENVRDAILATKGFQGVTGPLSFDEKGDRGQKLITIWRTTLDKPEGIAYVAPAPAE